MYSINNFAIITKAQPNLYGPIKLHVTTEKDGLLVNVISLRCCCASDCEKCLRKIWTECTLLKSRKCILLPTIIQITVFLINNPQLYT